MRVLMIGGIYGQSLEYREKVTVTPETALVAGLVERGHDVGTAGHTWTYDLGGFDVVHVHHLAKGLIPLLRQSGTPWVFTRHGTQPVQGPRRAVLAATLLRASAVVALSDAEQRVLRRRCRRTVRIYNGQDVEVFAPPTARRAPAEGGAWKLLYVGQLLDSKRVDVVIRAVALGAGQGLDVRAELVYHHGPDEHRLRGLADDLGIGARVTFTGALGRVDLAERMRQAHALCLPSLTEALPSVVSEAALTGLPVVATAVGGIAEQVPDPRRLVPIAQLDRFPLRVLEALADYDQREAEAHTWIGEARKRFSLPQMVASHESLYEELGSRCA